MSQTFPWLSHSSTKSKEKVTEARDLMQKVLELRPNDQGFQQLYQQLQAEASTP